MSILDDIIRTIRGNKNENSDKSGTEYAVVSTTLTDESSQNAKLFSRTILLISIVAIVLSIIPPFAASGLALGVVALVLSWYVKRKAKIDIQKAALCLSACAVFLGLVITGISANSANYDKLQLAQTGQELAALQEKATAQEEELAKEDPVLSLEIIGAEPTKVKSVQVVITGTTDTGIPVNDTRTIEVGHKNTLGYPSGDYQFAYAAFTAPDGKTLYKEGSASCSYDEGVAKSIPLRLVENTEEMQRIAAEQEAARRAAEEAARAEAEAAAAAEAAAREAEQAQSSISNEHTVYITKSGEKYHASGCQYLKKSKIPISEGDAIAQGYTPCSKCNP